MPGGLDPAASTPEATASVAQSRDRTAEPPSDDAARQAAADGGFDISPFLPRHVRVSPYQRRPDDPVYRPLRIFALDPGVSKLEGAVALVNVPYEPLERGPRGRLFHVEGDTGLVCDLEDPAVLIQQGYAPSRSDRRFHQQMVYAVCSSAYAAFKAALGRDPVWGFERDDDGVDPGALIVRPRAFPGRNAYYDKVEGALNFGYFTTTETGAGFMAGEEVFTCLSHDVIVHELTHALLDGMRSRFTIPTQIDVLAFHEAFADLVAVFQHFSYREVVLAAIRKARGRITGGLLTDLARPLGQSTSDRPSPLRRAVDAPDGTRLRYDRGLEVHELGSVLVLAVFDAFDAVYRRKTARYVRLATLGAGRLALRELPPDLQSVLAEEASQLASQFLSICIRAIDYCPPVDLELGEFLRAVVTADRELVPADPWGYREAWIDAFRERGIRPPGVTALDEDSLAWQPPRERLKPVRPLSFARLRFRGDPGRPAGAAELRRQAAALGTVIADPASTEAFGLRPARAGTLERPCIDSIRSARRVGPDGQVVFDIVAEVSQQQVRTDPATGRTSVFHGGSTVILGPEGEIRYVVGKGVDSANRFKHQAAFMESERGKRYWREDNGLLRPRPDLLLTLHGAIGSPASGRER